MTRPTANLYATELLAQALGKEWTQFQRVITQRRQPSSGRSDGRGNEIADPTGNTVAAASMWDEYEQEAAALTAEALGVLRQLEQKIRTVTHIELTRDEKARMRCSGEHDATCTELAAVPAKRGMCAAGYLKWWRTQKQPTS